VADLDVILGRELTPEQRRAVEDPSREILALACAGSGKSKTLAFRIARLIAEGADPKGLVAFTFTEKAADSIKLRVSQALGAVGLDPLKLGAMYIGTIHSYCRDVLAQMDARYRQYEVLDENRLKLYLVSRYVELGLGRLRDDRGRPRYFEVIRQVSDAWALLNDEMLDPAAVTARDAVLGGVLSELGARLRRDEYIDFSLMVRLVAEALERGDRGAERAIASLRHLMVDEYQDVNPAQETLIRELHRRSETLFAVGDDDQAIYGWRGADVANILTFTARHPAASQHTLATNFRSTRAVVDSSDHFAAAELGAGRLPKNPVADARHDGLPSDFRNVWFPDRVTEAGWVAERASSLLGTRYVERDGVVRGLTPGDFAILMRGRPGRQDSDGRPRHAAFTAALDRLGIPYSLEAGGGIFDRPEVAALRATFELLRDGSPDRPTVRAHFDRAVLPNFPAADFGRLAVVMAEWGRLIHTPAGGARRRVYPQRLVHELLEAFGLASTPFDQGVLHDLGVFSGIIQDAEGVFVSIDSPDRFQAILNFLANPAETGYETSTQDFVRRPDVVTISTVHKVKGLEFPAVFVVDVEAGRFPKRRGGYSGWLPIDVVGPALARGASQSTSDEEARLFYTAITRAERYLHVSGSEMLPGGKRASRRSPYALRLADREMSTDSTGLPAGLVPADPRPRIDETVVPTTFSDVRYYLRCPADYRFRKVYGFSPPITEMFGFGMTVHAAVGKLHEAFPTRPPSRTEAVQLAREVFHLKHVPPSRDPVNRPGGYERAQASAGRIAGDYVETYGEDFVRSRQVEVPFEVPIEQAVISGSIDLLLREDASGRILEASIVDFKAMEGGEEPLETPELRWSELALQVQLYAKAAREVLGENARTGSVHLLKDNQRLKVPVDDAAVEAAVANVEWAVDRILAQDFPMRRSASKCGECDFILLCAKTPQPFSTPAVPPPLAIPGGEGHRMVPAFSEFEGS
jgi:DNA helicase-2/ATP-dependent DNA helicase PcrA